MYFKNLSITVFWDPLDKTRHNWNSLWDASTSFIYLFPFFFFLLKQNNIHLLYKSLLKKKKKNIHISNTQYVFWNIVLNIYILHYKYFKCMFSRYFVNNKFHVILNTILKHCYYTTTFYLSEMSFESFVFVQLKFERKFLIPR